MRYPIQRQQAEEARHSGRTIPEDGIIDQVAISRALSGEHPAPRLTPTEARIVTDEMIRRVAAGWWTQQ